MYLAIRLTDNIMTQFSLLFHLMTPPPYTCGAQVERRKSIEFDCEACLGYDPKDIRLEYQLISWFNPPACINGGGPVASNSKCQNTLAVDHQGIPEQSRGWSYSVPQVDLDREHTVLELDRWTDHRTRGFHCLVGKIDGAALLVRQRDCKPGDDEVEFAHLSLSEVQSVILTSALDADKVLSHLVQLLSNDSRRARESPWSYQTGFGLSKFLGLPQRSSSCCREPKLH